MTPVTAVESAAEPRLDCHEGIVDPRVGCARWPEHFRLLNQTTGEVFEGRCKATNLCRYCQRLYVLETVEMLLLDAAEYAPTLLMVLTAREHLTRADCRRHLEQLRTAARRRWPDLEWFVQVEFQRRGALHLNLLIKGVPVEDRVDLHEVLSDRWCARVDAAPAGQWSGEVTEAGGIVRYLAKHLAHGLKVEQAPPIGWRGHRTSQTRGYLVRPASVMREEARTARRLKRELWRALQAGHRGHDAELAAHEALARAEASTWRLVQVEQRTEGHERHHEGPAGLGACVLTESSADTSSAAARERTEALGPEGGPESPPGRPDASRPPATVGRQPGGGRSGGTRAARRSPARGHRAAYPPPTTDSSDV